MEEKRTLAKYDFRSKQEYIYRTNRVREIVGASELITRAYNDFFEALEKSTDPLIRTDYKKPIEGKLPCAYNKSNGMLSYINNPDCVFDPEFGDDLEGKVIYIGGGNLYMLWRNEQIARAASGVLCKMLREKAYSLSPACGFTEYSGSYSEDMKKLNEAFESCKVSVPPFMPTAMLPFTELDRRTSLPVAHKCKKGESSPYMREDESISHESYLKRVQYKTTHGDKPELLDEMVTEKGRESLLAVIYIDGNNMGDRIRQWVSPDEVKDFSEGVKRIRAFSNSVQENFVTIPRTAIEQAAEKSEYAEIMKDKIRWIVSGGDEITLVCNARAALKIVELYFSELEKIAGIDGKKNTACAGIAIFHSHFPFSKAYAIAEECCESAKKRNRKNGGDNCIIDFQYIYAGVSGDLDSMRAADEKLIARPYLISGNASNMPLLQKDFIRRAERLRDSIGRSNIKQLAALLFDSNAEYDLELARLDAQFLKANLQTNKREDKKHMLDIAQFHDIWFSKDFIDKLDEFYNVWLEKGVC